MNKTIARSAETLLRRAWFRVFHGMAPGDALRMALPGGTTYETMSARQRRAVELAHRLLLDAARARGATAADALIALGQLAGNRARADCFEAARATALLGAR